MAPFAEKRGISNGSGNCFPTQKMRLTALLFTAGWAQSPPTPQLRRALADELAEEKVWNYEFVTVLQM